MASSFTPILKRDSRQQSIHPSGHWMMDEEFGSSSTASTEGCYAAFCPTKPPHLSEIRHDRLLKEESRRCIRGTAFTPHLWAECRNRLKFEMRTGRF